MLNKMNFFNRNNYNLFNRDSYAKYIDDNTVIYSSQISRNNLANNPNGNTYTGITITQNNGRSGLTYPTQRPLQIYRKQYQPQNIKSNLSVIGVFDKPGISTQTNKDKICLDCSNNNVFNENIINKNNIIRACNDNSCKFFDPSLNRVVCIACNPENNIIRSASTIVTNSYSFNTNQFLHRRNRTIDQNQLGYKFINHERNSAPHSHQVSSGLCNSSCSMVISQNRDAPTSGGRIARLNYETRNKFNSITPSYQRQINKVNSPRNQCVTNNLIFRKQNRRIHCPST